MFTVCAALTGRCADPCLRDEVEHDNAKLMINAIGVAFTGHILPLGNTRIKRHARSLRLLGHRRSNTTMSPKRRSLLYSC